MKVLVFIETKEGKPLGGSLELLGAAEKLGTVSAVLVGTAPEEAAKAAADYGTAVAAVKVEADVPDAVVAVLEKRVAAEGAEVVLFAGTQLGKDLAPRLAQRLGTGCVTDVTGMAASEAGNVQFERPAFGGTVIETMAIAAGKPQVATVRGGSFAKPAAGQAAEVTVETAELPQDAIRARVVEVAKEITEAVNLEGADIIVTGGRGMGDAEGFKLIEELAELLGGVVGASRPAIEEGWVSRAHQVGQSGKIVAPKLYIACGISGAMQHVSGIMGSKYIVAINKDEAASIFDIADVGIVGDVKVILPLIIEAIKQRNA